MQFGMRVFCQLVMMEMKVLRLKQSFKHTKPIKITKEMDIWMTLFLSKPDFLNCYDNSKYLTSLK